MFRQLLTAFNHTRDEALSMLAKDGSTVVIGRDGKRVCKGKKAQKKRNSGVLRLRTCLALPCLALPCIALHCIAS